MRQMMTISAAVLVALGVLVAPATDAGASPSKRAKASGTVDVLYAGSFLDLMEQRVDPAFHKATGFTVSGYSAGSTALATEISGGTQVGDVFISASPAVWYTSPPCNSTDTVRALKNSSSKVARYGGSRCSAMLT